MKFLLITLITHLDPAKTTRQRFREVVDNAVLGEELFTAVTTLSLLDPVRAFEDYSTLDNLSGGRLELIIGKGNGTAQAELFNVTAVTRHGEHLRVEGARLSRLPDPVPEIYFGGSSKAAGPVAAAHADVYLTWGEPPAQVASKIEWIRGLNPGLRFGVRLHVIARDTAEAAWAEAERLLRVVSPADIEAVQAGLRRSESEGQRRMLDLHGGSRDGLVVAPNLWAGVGLVRGGAGTALVGSHTEIADRIAEYADLGITEFILSGYPHLEEAYWFGEGVLPELRRRGLWRHPDGGGTGAVSVPFAGVPDPATA
ncbi:LLM class flavin-dependent oxidoreductase [Actinoplanes sp. NPDC049118]|uniref:LLM class flavin-dependent oxidoreductase n=1 Tax=Actinoplanes sp. NPDC049118 TaxID=3155769 RepID=UPI0033F8ACEC